MMPITEGMALNWFGAVIGAVAVFLLNIIVSYLRQIARSQSESNTNVTRLLERSEFHDKRITSLEKWKMQYRDV